MLSKVVTLLNAFARWNINDQVAVQANVNNITDEQYINSLQTVGYYGARQSSLIETTGADIAIDGQPHQKKCLTHGQCMELT